MFKGAKKEDLRRIASELELCVSDKLTVLDFMDLIKNCDRYKNDPDSVHELANLIIEERKYDESQQLELEKIREKSKLDLEIARIRANDKDNNTEVNCNDSFSVDSLIKREKAANIIIYLKDEDLKNYDKIKSIILQQFEPTPQSCLENFKKATRQNCESHVQFASRLTTNWEYYLKLRNVSNFENTVFGYIASGSIPVSSENKPHCGLIKDNVDLEKTMRRFWEIENVEPETIKNKETIICEEHFQKNHTRDSTGRYIVSMPFKKDPNCLGQSKDIALKKLNSLWNRLKREPNYLKLYRDFLKEYKELGHMQEVDEREECGMYFIPHLGVYRSDKNK
ncbi:uncharacterized protein TNCV_1340151 [Trichonephila clavipes]|uniref:Uncharacterized protein n=1 Tax=Trichonephila clavipes TaxID=2585209 RepID=A0A8X6RCP4_TRICX|nr:uncharacterized protein TNCV_1340151 [Trichonephila clavipes]